MTPDEERWGLALAVMKWKGDGALAYVAERISALEEAGQAGGVALWRDVERRMLEIREAERRRQ